MNIICKCINSSTDQKIIFHNIEMNNSYIPLTPNQTINYDCSNELSENSLTDHSKIDLTSEKNNIDNNKNSRKILTPTTNNCMYDDIGNNPKKKTNDEKFEKKLNENDNNILDTNDTSKSNTSYIDNGHSICKETDKDYSNSNINFYDSSTSINSDSIDKYVNNIFL